MKKYWNDQVKNLIIALTSVGVILLAFYFAISRIQVVKVVVNLVITTLAPFIIGFVISFLLAPFMYKVEGLLTKHTKMGPKLKRGLSVTASLLFLFLIIFIFFLVITPEIVDSVVTLSNSIDSY